MYRLYTILKDRAGPPDDDEVAFASGQKTMDPDTASAYFGRAEAASANLVSMFMKQSQQNAVSRSTVIAHRYCMIYAAIFQEKAFDSETFKRYLAEWVVACDQPFEEVDRPEFRRLLEYIHMGSKALDIPHRNALKDRIMKMGKSTTEGIQKLIKVWC
jgi:hypothetical protein